MIATHESRNWSRRRVFFFLFLFNVVVTWSYYKCKFQGDIKGLILFIFAFGHYENPSWGLTRTSQKCDNVWKYVFQERQKDFALLIKETT